LARKSRKVIKKAKRKSRPTGPAPIPPGYRSLTPYLCIAGASEAIEFYKKAFAAKELRRHAMPDGKILNAELRIGDSMIMVSDEFPGSDVKSPATLGGSAVTVHLYTKDVDGLWATALAAGAKVTMPMDNMFWGERYGQLVDPFGHRWSLSKRVKMSRQEMEDKQKAAMEMFARGEHPESPATPS